MKYAIAFFLALTAQPVASDHFRLVGIDCDGVFMSYDEEDEFPVPCAEIMPIEDYCSTDTGVEDAFCVGYRPNEILHNETLTHP